MESIASKLKARRESLNISLEQIAEATRISIHHLRSLESGCYDDLPSGMYRRAILRSYCNEIGLDSDEVLRYYDDEVTPHQEKPVMTPLPPQSFKIKTHAATVWGLIIIIGVGLFIGREWLISNLSPYFSSDYSGQPGNLPAESPQASAKTATVVNMDAAENPAPATQVAKIAEAAVNKKVAPTVSLNTGNKVVETSSELTPLSTLAAGDDDLQPLRLEIIGKEECWLSIDRDETGAVTKILAPGDMVFYTATRTIFLVIGNAAGVSLHINGRAAKPLGQSGQVVRLTIDKDTLQNLIDPYAS